MDIAIDRQLSHGFKEWAVAVDSLAAGETIMLLRKGGIRETTPQFQVQHRQVWLYPTYEHQKPELLKPKYASLVKPVASGWHPETISINCYAAITHVFSLDNWTTIQTLLPYHIWNEHTIIDRFNWKPQQPLAVLLLRVFRLPQAQIIPFHPTYKGCKSWIDLTQPISTINLQPIITEAEYERQVAEILKLVQ